MIQPTPAYCPVCACSTPACICPRATPASAHTDGCIVRSDDGYPCVCQDAQQPSDAASLREAFMADSPMHALVLYWTHEAFIAGYRGSVGVTGFDAEAEREYTAWLAQRDARTAPQAQAGSEEPTTP